MFIVIIIIVMLIIVINSTLGRMKAAIRPEVAPSILTRVFFKSGDLCGLLNSAY